MSTLPLLFHLMVVLLALAVTIAGSFRWAEAAYVSPAERKNSRPVSRWLPLRMSNCLILLSAVYGVLTCFERRAFGSVPELFLCAAVIMAGAALSAKGY